MWSGKLIMQIFVIWGTLVASQVLSENIVENKLLRSIYQKRGENIDSDSRQHGITWDPNEYIPWSRSTTLDRARWNQLNDERKTDSVTTNWDIDQDQDQESDIESETTDRDVDLCGTLNQENDLVPCGTIDLCATKVELIQDENMGPCARMRVINQNMNTKTTYMNREQDQKETMDSYETKRDIVDRDRNWDMFPGRPWMERSGLRDDQEYILNQQGQKPKLGKGFKWDLVENKPALQEYEEAHGPDLGENQHGLNGNDKRYRLKPIEKFKQIVIGYGLGSRKEKHGSLIKTNDWHHSPGRGVNQYESKRNDGLHSSRLGDNGHLFQQKNEKYRPKSAGKTWYGKKYEEVGLGPGGKQHTIGYKSGKAKKWHEFTNNDKKLGLALGQGENQHESKLYNVDHRSKTEKELYGSKKNDGRYSRGPGGEMHDEKEKQELLRQQQAKNLRELLFKLKIGHKRKRLSAVRLG